MQVAEWNFERIIPSHLDGPIDTTPADFISAIDSALTSTPEGLFGADAATLIAVEKLSVDLKTLEKPSPLR